jgi:hypothetical protein
VLTLREYITSTDTASEDDGEVKFMRSGNLDTVSVTFPGGMNLDDRADRLNAFVRALAEFQYRDVLVVALCVGEKP